ncbi:DNA topoisomerase II [Serratia phage phiMAM1]|uniref:DNA topoisomerase (ATP-hydrolyzing) n=1 Tax=Serratia phage phiMAM1 TaxID=1262513 RepID=K7YBC5_9CAUD|nr:DNA topoisomerase II [Serratia phage phiMAM1]AFX93657.1 DNA topoisomerase II medium subunit [Serratia phage phiMAM1]
MTNKNTLSVTDFVNHEHKEFSVVNSIRQIPSIIDGLKPSQRKVLFSAIEYGKEELVDRLAMFSAARTAYKSGGDNLSGVVVNMARGFQGTNNIPYFDRDGQFGSIVSKEAASVRYISVSVSKVISAIFKKEDNDILEHYYLGDEKMDPKFFLPVLPMILINGVSAIGSGYASDIPNHSVKSVINALKCLLDGREHTPLIPHYEGFTGVSQYDSEGRVYVEGVYQLINATTLKITDVPPGKFSKTYEMKYLLPLVKDGTVIEYINDTNELNGWDITVQFKRGVLSSMSPDEIREMLGLVTRTSSTLVAWDENGYIRPYASVDEILIDFFNYRLSRYEDRRQHMMASIRSKMAELDKMRMFIGFITNTDLNKDISELKSYFLDNYNLYHIRDTISLHCDSMSMTEADVDRMFKISLSSISLDARERLSARLQEMLKQLQTLENQTDVDLYKEDIKIVEKELGL